ncbi:hypothetical protein BpHYR1_009996 [Brachionus plicatilis]|uniref:Uncharacterized protein n=1 Tax=Brachionus plicatilis TaxID=10195 RepID=A0A3M7PCB5_BRAPC|nr:hypothetical protein BpHYR1_009996 [Brachionus plicatilis]
MIENQFLNIDQQSYMPANQVTGIGYTQTQPLYYQEPVKPFYYGHNSAHQAHTLPHKVDSQPSAPGSLAAQSNPAADRFSKKTKKSKEINDFNCK